MQSILILEDNKQIAHGLKSNLEYEGFFVQIAGTGEQAEEIISSNRFDIMLLDIMLPDTDGFLVLKKLRKAGNNIPVIILSARGDEFDKLQGFRLGADDYVTKPFGLMELIARINAILNRVENQKKENVLSRSGIVLDIEKRTATVNNHLINLSPLEFDLLVVLLQKEGNVATREFLLEKVWGYINGNAVSTRTIDSHIANIRKKISENSHRNVIETVPKIGYKIPDIID